MSGRSLITATLLLLLGCNQLPSITTHKAKAQQLETIPTSLQQNLPKKGVVFISGDFDPSYSFNVDLERRHLDYTHYDYLAEPHLSKGEHTLSKKEGKKIVRSINAIWTDPKNFEPEFYPARVMNMTVILADHPDYRVFHFGGYLVGEMDKLFRYLIRRVKP